MHSNEKDEVYHSFLVEITKSLHRGTTTIDLIQGSLDQHLLKCALAHYIQSFYHY